MSNACRNSLAATDATDATAATRDDAHAGLLLARYLTAQKSPEAKNALFRRAHDATANVKSVYKKAFTRWQEMWEKVAGDNRNNLMREFTVDSRLIIGLGGENVLETGLTLHHTYGVPYIPGAALKGLCAHYYADGLVAKMPKPTATDPEKLKKEIQKQYDAAKKDPFYAAVFGDQKSAGMVQFHDAWICPDSVADCLVDDVMTPHHSDYYAGKAAPTDFDAPVPVSFLAVTGKFLVVLTCDDTDDDGKITVRGQNWLNKVWELLGAALAQNGIGGKTNSGYGYGELRRMSKDKKVKTETPTPQAAPTNWLAAALQKPK
ncbi:hypothetical protein FACS1894139_06450 [Planctomycetales bacterium]|nr:hypothetical protein FACS1894107_03780 [Planctomycetales bacterium]GHT04392.1 hypothetical protein FACS1894139_06450 [Planctomycetales bacterium]